MFKPHGIVHEEAMHVATDLGLPRWWLNEQASTYISGKQDADKRRVFDHPGLRVMAASPRHIFAMKALAARTRDIDDPRRHRRSGISRRSPADMRELLPRRTPIPEIRRRPPRTIQLTTPAAGICPPPELPRVATSGPDGLTA
jgi:hypothetical protein